MTKEEILHNLTCFNEELAAMDIRGELCLYGGAVMCLVFDARPNTKDVDALFLPDNNAIRLAAYKVAEKNNCEIGWLNDAVKVFVKDKEKILLYEMSNLKIFHTPPLYLFAMKIIAARANTQDKEDAILLAKHLKITNREDALSIIRKYYPEDKINEKTKLFLKDIYHDINKTNEIGHGRKR